LPARLDVVQACELAAETEFAVPEIELLYEAFKKISDLKTPDGLIDVNEFKKAFGWEESEVAERLFHVFDLDGDQNVDFPEFVKGLAICRNGSVEEKTKLLFRLYDMNGDGRISKEELYNILRASMLENFSLNLTEKHMRRIVDHTFDLFDLNHDDFLDFDEFTKLAAGNPVILNGLRFDLPSV